MRGACHRPSHQPRIAHAAGTGRLNGRSEELLGRFIREYPGPQRARDGVLVATKLAAYPWRLTPGQFVSAVRWATPGDPSSPDADPAAKLAASPWRPTAGQFVSAIT